MKREREEANKVGDSALGGGFRGPELHARVDREVFTGSLGGPAAQPASQLASQPAPAAGWVKGDGGRG